MNDVDRTEEHANTDNIIQISNDWDQCADQICFTHLKRLYLVKKSSVDDIKNELIKPLFCLLQSVCICLKKYTEIIMLQTS